MSRYALVLVCFALVWEGTVHNANADDNPVVRALLRDLIKRELSAKDCKEKGWRQGNTLIWFDNPAANLAADISRFSLESGRINIEGRASALIDFNHKMTTLIGSKTYSGQAIVYLSFKASTQAGERLTGSRVNIGRLEIHDLRLHGDAARAFQGLIEDGVNMVLRNKKHEIEKKIEEALDRANLANYLGNTRTQ